MYKIVTRQWINDDAIFYCYGQKYDKDGLCRIIDYCKYKLIECGAKRGHKIGVTLLPTDIFYTALLFAIFELGLKLTVLHRFHSPNETFKPKAKAHMPLDIFVCYDDKNTMYAFDLTIQHYIKNSDKVICITKEWNLTNSLKCSYETPVWARPGDDILLCNSSGTTGDPKLIYHNHEYIYGLCSYNWHPMELENNDAVFHMSSINHGASLSVLYLPSIRKCKTHYLSVQHLVEADKGYPYYIFLTAKDRDITKLLSPNASITDSIIDSIEKDDIGLPDTTIIVVSFINPKWLKVIKEGKLKKIISAFGCSETGGPLLVPYIDKTTENFNPLFLGKPTTGFYDTKQIDGLLTVDLPNGKRVITEDIVDEKEDGLYFIRKNKLRKINDIEINPLDIIEKAEKFCSRNRFEVVVDEIYNELYIVTDSKELVGQEEEVKSIIKEIYNSEVELKSVLYMKNYSFVTVAVKPDRDKLLEFIDSERKNGDV